VEDVPVIGYDQFEEERRLICASGPPSDGHD
jgi:hypothetical protein